MLFFDKGTPTRNVWYYQLNLDRNLGKTNSLNESDLAEFIELQASRASAAEGPETPNSWNVDVSTLSVVEGYDLSPKNPNKKEETALRSPKVILDEMKTLDAESTLIMEKLKLIIKND